MRVKNNLYIAIYYDRNPICKQFLFLLVHWAIIGVWLAL